MAREPIELCWEQVKPPDGYQTAYAAPYGLKIFRACGTFQPDVSWRLEMCDVKGGIEFVFGGISHERSLQDCIDRVDAAIARGESWIAD